jgi:hypothetical protein
MAAAAAPRTRTPPPAPDSAAQRRPLGDLTASERAPGWGLRHPRMGKTLPRIRRHLSSAMLQTPVAQHDRNSAGGRRRRSHAGEWGTVQGQRSRGGGGGIAMRPPPASLLRCGDSYGGGTGVTSETMGDKQTTIKS